MNANTSTKSANHTDPVVSPIRVAVCGALGKMGQEVVRAVLADRQCQLVAAVDHHQAGQPVASVISGTTDYESAQSLQIEPELTTVFSSQSPDVCVDFTHPNQVFSNAMKMIEAGCRPVIGTTGLSPEELAQIETRLKEKQLGGMVIPNFAIGAVLMMKFAAMASKYYDHAEIIELHHNKKADAPSGTAIKTAELMSDALKQAGKTSFVGSEVPEKEIYSGARGASVGDGAVHIHSVRLPGYVAHQEVLLSGPGEVLTLRHDSMDRKSFMPGVILAVKAVMNRPGLTYGLEHILD
jgi:4-hydroxy-tetrahydrodipicolinate reductase